MKTRILTSTAILAFVAASITAQAQSSLTPPAGTPAPSSHTLNEVYDKATTIEGQSTAHGTKIDSVQAQVNNLGARKPLVAGTPGVTISANGTITISSPGSYYLTANKLITTTGAHGIAIFSRDVTLDLNGFSLQCGSGTGGSAILIDAANGTRQIHICNGFIRGGSTWNGTSFAAAGWTHGISGAAADVSISNVTINGIRSHGIDCTNARVSDCDASECGGMGISAAIVKACKATKCLGHAIAATKVVDQSYGECVGTTNPTPGLSAPRGIHAQGAAVTNSTGSAVLGDGIAAETVSHSRGFTVSGTGVFASTADNCVGGSTASAGVSADLATQCVGTTADGFAAITARVASYCKGTHTTNGTAINATIAVACNTGSGAIVATQKHLGTP